MKGAGDRRWGYKRREICTWCDKEKRAVGMEDNWQVSLQGDRADLKAAIAAQMWSDSTDRDTFKPSTAERRGPEQQCAPVQSPPTPHYY